MATWAMRQRYDWIKSRLDAGETFNRDDLVRAFTVTKQTATATISQYRDLNPGALRYDGSLKAFVKSDSLSLVGISARERMLANALRRIKAELTIPAAEYVPAIPACWTIVDEALATLAPQAATLSTTKSGNE